MLLLTCMLCLRVAGSAEQGECEQQMVASLTQLTRQQLADMLLQQLEQQQQQQQYHIEHTAAGRVTGPALPVSKTAPEHQQQHTIIAFTSSSSSSSSNGICFSSTATASSSSNILLSPSSNSSSSSSSSELQWQQHAELREAMFQIIKAAQQQQQQAAGLTSGRQFNGLNRYQAMLLRWLKAGSSSSSSSSSSNSSGMSQQRSPAAAVAHVEVLLLHAQLAVKVQRWQVAQHAAASAEQELRQLVSAGDKDERCFLCVRFASWYW
jgi:hypothetical protein